MTKIISFFLRSVAPTSAQNQKAPAPVVLSKKDLDMVSGGAAPHAGW
jgi:hypothetical protein